MTTAANGSAMYYISRCDGTSFHSMGSGLNAQMHAMAIYGGKLYVGGDFTHAGGIECNGIAMWDGSWHALGAGLTIV